MWEVIEHIPPNTEARALGETFRVLKNNGILLLSTPSDHLYQCCWILHIFRGVIGIIILIKLQNYRIFLLCDS